VIRRRNITREEVKTQSAFESRVAVIKGLVLKLVDVTVHRRMISTDILGEFLDNKLTNNNLEQLPKEDSDQREYNKELVEDNSEDQEL
jgi:hypothetical protein